MISDRVESELSVGTATTLREIATLPEDVIVVEGDAVAESFYDIQKKVMELRNQEQSDKGIILVFRTRGKFKDISLEEADILAHESGADAFVFDERPAILKKKQALAIQMVSNRMRRGAHFQKEASEEKPDGEKCGCKIWISKHLVTVNGIPLKNLRPKRFAFMEMLISSRRDYVPFESLQKITESSNENRHQNYLTASMVKELNRLLRPLGVEIKNVYSLGYRLAKIK